MVTTLELRWEVLYDARARRVARGRQPERSESVVSSCYELVEAKRLTRNVPRMESTSFFFTGLAYSFRLRNSDSPSQSFTLLHNAYVMVPGAMSQCGRLHEFKSEDESRSDRLKIGKAA